MRKNFIVLLLLTSLQIFSQDKVFTTQEEYNYLTRGYSQDIKTGHDLKPGYTLEKFYEKKDEDFSFEFYFYVENKTKNTKAIMSISKKFKKGKIEKIVYDCIPFNNKKLILKDDDKGLSMGLRYDDIMRSLNTQSFELLRNNPSGKFE